jgi:transposase-like protein
VRRWPEVKSRRGAPKRRDTEGFACPNHRCPSFGITDAHVHALVGDGKHGRAERIQTFRGPACRTTFTSRRHTVLSRLKTPSRQVAVVLTALAEGLDPSAAERVAGLPSGHDHEPFCRALGNRHRRCTNASSAISGSHISSSMNCERGCGVPSTWCGFGWPLIPSPRLFPCSIWGPARSTWHACSSTPCDRSWLPAVCPSSPVTA